MTEDLKLEYSQYLEDDSSSIPGASPKITNTVSAIAELHKEKKPRGNFTI